MKNFITKIKEKLNNIIKRIKNKKWMKSALNRAVRTFFQTFLAMVGTATLMSDVNWKIVISGSLLAFICSVATSLTGLPEVDEE